ncbi:MAG: phosphonate monoester hydrolase [Rhodobacteraceae bacterium]|nr:MAG: phosphonate monoester hydrolase [Paracoccaceae bacterium]
MAKKRPNILFIMADQLRNDYLSCYGHPTLETPAIDALAKRGVQFNRAYVNATVCGPSRMSYYTGRYMSSHGSTWNGVPLRIGEPTMGDHLRKQGYRVALVGKTHMTADERGIERLGLDVDAIEGVYATQAGFEPYERDDGLHPDMLADPNLAYNKYLRDKGYDGENPWHTAANAGVDEDKNVLSGWFMRNSTQPANVADEHSETAYMTDRAMDFINEAGDDPWCLHLSFIKPHWPYIVSAPYHNMYGPDDMIPPNRNDAEKDAPHPVYKAYMNHIESETFSDDDVRKAVVPIYMGLIKQMDDHLARLFQFMKDKGIYEDTFIVMSSDHGDYLGDHWLGEKELFHDESVRVPLIVVDPDKSADATRGMKSDEMVQAIDLVPTFYDLAKGTGLDHILEGQSLLPILRATGKGHDYIISELDYGQRPAGIELEREPKDSRAYMVLSKRWKYIYFEGFDAQLFDLETDPKELTDLGTDPKFADIRAQHQEQLFDWARQRRMRITMSEAEMKQRQKIGHRPIGVIIGEW